MNDSLDSLDHHTAVARDPVLFGILHAAKAIESRLEEALGRIGLSTARYTVLEQLALAREPIPLSELAARVSCVRSNITQLVDRLEADGLVSRVGDPDDRRAVRAELTHLGWNRQAAGAEEFRTVQHEFAAGLADADRQSLTRLLAALC